MGKTAHPVRALKDAVRPKAKLVKKSVCSMWFIVNVIKLAGLILFYYTFSIGLTFYNQRFVRKFKIPLSFTLAHLVIKYLMSAFVRSMIECKTKEARIILPWKLYLSRLAPTGMTCALDIGLSNWSFEFITISLYTMTKSTAVIFILGFSLLLKLEKPRWSLIIVVFFISSGLFLFTYHSTQFNLEGFIMVLTAAVLSGLRWTLAQVVTQKNEIGLHNPIDMMYHVQPWMILTLLPFAAVFEGMKLSTSKDFFHYQDLGEISINIGLVLLGAVIAFFLEFSEFLFLVHTSSLTLSISGIFKEICTLYLAAKVNKDKMNLVNGIGLIVCLSGISLHILLKIIYRKQEDNGGSVSQEEAMEMLKANGQANSDGESDENELFNATKDR